MFCVTVISILAYRFPVLIPIYLRDWSLITGGGGEKRFSAAEGGHTKFWGSFYMVA